MVDIFAIAVAKILRNGDGWRGGQVAQLALQFGQLGASLAQPILHFLEFAGSVGNGINEARDTSTRLYQLAL